jgi:hypothetical protein
VLAYQKQKHTLKLEEIQMGQASPLTKSGIDPSLAGRILEIADNDCPRTAYTVLTHRLGALQAEGRPIPPHLTVLKERLASECCALSQGR